MSTELSILIVDDNPGDVYLICEMLAESEGTNFTVQSVSRIADALTLMESETFGVVLLDLNLPDSFGLETFDVVRNIAPLAAIVILTGLGEQELALSALQKGADDFLVKGEFSGSTLLRSVRYSRERKCAAQKLMEIEMRFRVFLDNSPTIAWAKDEDGRYVYINLMYEKRFAVSLTDLYGKTDLEVWQEEVAREFRKNDKIVLDSNQSLVVIETTIALDGKKTQWLNSRFCYLDNARKRFVGGVGVDVTEHQRSQEELRTQLARLQLALDAAKAGIWDWNLQTNKIYWSEEIWGLFGIVPHSVEASFAAWVSLVFEDDRAKAEDAVLEDAANHKPLSLEYRVKHSDGSLKTLFAMGRPAFADNGAVVSYVGVIIDITERKKLESDLRSALDRAKESDRIKLNFLANMSHEIRTPMNAIVGFSDLLRFSEFSAEQKDHYIDIIQKNSENLLVLIDDILDVSKLESQKIVIRETDGSINDMFYSLETSFSRLISLENRIGDIALRFQFLPNDFTCSADFGRLTQVLTNLIGNAVKFTEKGFVECGCKVVDDNELLFFVRDTGPGIPRENFEHIFKRFVQLENDVTTKVHGGSGLGLSICEGLVSLWKGRIWLESEVGVGSTFFFTLPLKNQKMMGQKHATGALELDTSGFNWEGKIFVVVEDNEASRFLLEERLRDSNATIYFAKNGVEAMQLFQSLAVIDLVIMDIFLPDKSGLELTKIVKETHKECLVFAQTAGVFEHEVKACYAAGCDEVVFKPVSFGALLSLMEKRLKGACAQPI